MRTQSAAPWLVDRTKLSASTPSPFSLENFPACDLACRRSHPAASFIRLLPEHYAHLNPMPFEAAVQMEMDLAEDLRRAGYTVTGGH